MSWPIAASRPPVRKRYRVNEPACWPVNALSVTSHGLCDRQGPISQYFASKNRQLDFGEFDDFEVSQAITGAPILHGCLAYMDCQVTMRHPGGDHTIFVGEVKTFGVDDEREPLLFYRGH